MKNLKISNCGECPFREEFCGGKKTACGHLGVKVNKPYSQDRYVDPTQIADICPLP
jgi:hypothetical protein